MSHSYLTVTLLILAMWLTAHLGDDFDLMVNYARDCAIERPGAGTTEEPV